MTRSMTLILALLLLGFLAGCGSTPEDDRAAIELIADDLGRAVDSDDMMMVEKHLSSQAKSDGYDGNRFLMECSYGEDVRAMFQARTVQLMGDSAHVMFEVMPAGATVAPPYQKTVVRLFKVSKWRVASFDVVRNMPIVEPDSLETAP